MFKIKNFLSALALLPAILVAMQSRHDAHVRVALCLHERDVSYAARDNAWDRAKVFTVLVALAAIPPAGVQLLLEGRVSPEIYCSAGAFVAAIGVSAWLDISRHRNNAAKNQREASQLIREWSIPAN